VGLFALAPKLLAKIHEIFGQSSNFNVGGIPALDTMSCLGQSVAREQIEEGSTP